MREELGPEYADLQLSDLNPKAFIAKHLGPDATDELDSVAQELRGARASLDAAVAAGPVDSPAEVDSGAVSGLEDAAAGTRPLPPFDSEAT
ncbi:MAG: hypothetical protein QM695_15680 [Micropruina sp.]